MNSTKRKATLASKAKKAGLPAQTVYNRMHNGWTEKKALSVPNGKYKKDKVAYKVEPKKEETPRSAVKIPMEGVEKFEAPKNDNGMYLAIGLVALALMLVVAIAQN
tara:strand:- start:246 stop:563 length:318 start_codon:yes stop_codon:yes gene_type:complete